VLHALVQQVPSTHDSPAWQSVACVHGVPAARSAWQVPPLQWAFASQSEWNVHELAQVGYTWVWSAVHRTAG
jgi:hypothetical protein